MDFTPQEGDGTRLHSPDGNWLVLHVGGKREDLYVVRTDGTGLRQLTDDEHEDRAPRWSPDGKRIAFHSSRGGSTPQIWTINPDGSGLQQLTRDRGRAIRPVWSPDGSRLAYLRDRDAVIVELGKPGAEASVDILPRSGRQNSWFEASSWSPDGRRLAGAFHSAARDPTESLCTPRTPAAMSVLRNSASFRAG